MNKRLTFTLPLPPSVNNSYVTVPHVTTLGKRTTRRVASKPLQRFKQAAPFLLYEQGVMRGLWYNACSVGYDIDIYLRTRRGDLSNRIKAYEDVVSGYLGFDDVKIMECHLKKHLDSQRPRIDGCWYLIAS